MNLDELQSVRDRERQTDKLQQLRESFYADAGQFIQQLRAERDRAAARADDPWNSPEATRLNDEIETASQLVEDIYERRIGKLVKAASLDAAGLPADVEGLSSEETELFDVLVSDIQRHRERVADIVDGTESADDAVGPSVSDGQTPAPETPGESAGTEEDSQSVGHEPTAADAMGRGDGLAAGDAKRHEPAESEPQQPTDSSQEQPPTEQPPTEQPQSPQAEDEHSAVIGVDPSQRNDTSTEPESPPDDAVSDQASRLGDGGVDRERVLVTEDIETFLGFDERDYDLSTDDVVTLPSPNADILIERNVARRL